MNSRILLLAVSIVSLSSCSAVYKSGQTPDDVYYSPAPQRQQADYVDVKQPKDGSNFQSYEQYTDGLRDDRFLRMSVGNPYYMDSYNSYGAFDWRYNSFYDGFNYGFSSPWNNYFAWNNFYNPYAPGFSMGYGGFSYSNYYYPGIGGGYYGGGVKYTAAATPISRPRTFNLSSYTNSNRPAARTYNTTNSYYNNANQRYNNSNSSNARSNNSYYNTNNNARSTYSPGNSNSGNSNSTPARSYTPAPSGGGGGGSSSGGGGGGVSRPSRGN